MRVSVNFIAVLVLCLVGGLLVAPHAKADSNVYWSDQFGIPDFSGRIYDAVMYKGELIVVGQFDEFAGIKEVCNVAAFDGTDWRSLNSIDGIVNQLEIWNDKLIVSGWGIIYEYDGVEWSVFTRTVPRWGPHSIAIYNDDLYYGCVDGLFKWDGADWQGILLTPTTPSDTTVYCRTMTVYDGRLIFAYCVTFDGDDSHAIVAWDGTNFEVIGNLSATSSPITHLAVYNDELIALGTINEIDGVAAHNAVAYDGSSWRALGEGLAQVWDNNKTVVYQNKLVVNTSYNNGENTTSPCLLSWNGSEWSSLSDEFIENATPLFVFDDKLYVLGKHVDPVTGELHHLTVFDGSEFEPVIERDGLGINSAGIVTKIIGYDGDVIVCGNYNEAGKRPVRNIARFDGYDWQNMNYNLTWNRLGCVADIIEYQDELYLGSNRNLTSDTYDTCAVMHLVGDQWLPLDDGLVSHHTTAAQAVHKFFVYNDELYISGESFALDGVDLGTLIKWDGSTISEVQVPEDLGIVNAVTEYEGDLILGGFATGPDCSTTVYRWNGSDFTAMGSPLPHTSTEDTAAVRALAVYNGELFLGGQFRVVSGYNYINSMLRWDGSEWVALDSYPNSTVYDFVLHKGKLYTMGKFPGIGGVYYYGIGCWNGNQWTHLGSELQSSFATCGLSYNDKLIVGGNFLYAGGKTSSKLAIWDQPGSGCCMGLTGNIDGDQLDIVSLGDLSALIDHLFISLGTLPCPEEANLDNDPANISLGDLTALIDHLFISLAPTKLCP